MYTCAGVGQVELLGAGLVKKIRLPDSEIPPDADTCEPHADTGTPELVWSTRLRPEALTS